MSNFLTIATVTATLQQALQEALLNDVKEATVTTVRPDRDADSNQARANIYLYQVTPNAAFRNNDLPSRNSSGELVQRPRAALDLHYLISCYGEESDLQPQRLLGSIVRRLHEQPMLTRKMMQETIAARPVLSKSNLIEEVEHVKFTPSALTLEELSKLWSVFFQARYALSAAYQASIVFIDGEETPGTPLPVREPKVYVRPFHQPIIESIESEDGPRGPVYSGGTLVIKGKRLQGDVTLVRISGQEGLLDPTQAKGGTSNNQISLQVPNGLPAGTHAVQVVHQIDMGDPAVPHSGVESNVAAFVLRPSIEIEIGKTKQATILTVSFTPKVQKGQRVLLALNEIPAKGKSARAYIVRAPKDNGIGDPDQFDTKDIKFVVSDIPKADYLVRVQVDDAQSSVTTDKAGKYISPRITIK